MKLKQFQKQDLARAGLHNGLILSWDTGLGKTWAMFLWPLLKCGHDVVHSLTNEIMAAGGAVAPVALDAALCRIRPKLPVLIIAPGDLHAQITAEAWSHFRIRVILLDSQAEFDRRTRKAHRFETELTDDGRPVIAPEFYLTSYTQLATNGVTKLPDPDAERDPVALLQTLGLKIGEHQPVKFAADWDDHPDFADACTFFAWRKARWADDYQRLGTDPDGTLDGMEANYERESRRLDEYARRNPALAENVRKERALLEASRDVLKMLLTTRPGPTYRTLAPSQQNFVLRAFLTCKMETYAANIGYVQDYELVPAVDGRDPQWRKVTPPLPGTLADPNAPVPEAVRSIKCLNRPSLSDLSYNAFDCVVIDEGVKMKGEDTYVGLGVRHMDPRFRLLLTATPVKNRLVDIFRLAWWAAGGRTEAHARFPYRDDTEERGKFAQTFMVSESNLTKKAAAEAEGRSSGSRYTKLTAEVCNVHRLWKMLGPLVLRRRKDDCNEDIVPKIRRVVRCEMGTAQQDVYSYHLQAKYLDKNDEEAMGAQLQALRMAAADPSSDHLKAQPGRCTKPCACALQPVPADVQAGRLVKARADLLAAYAKVPNPKTKDRLNHENQLAELAARILKPVQVFDKKLPEKNCPICAGSGAVDLPSRSGTAYVPKMATTLTLIEEILARQEQVVVFSAFNDPLDKLSGWLDEASVRHIKLDGRTSQKQRGTLAANFKRGRYRTPDEDGPEGSYRPAGGDGGRNASCPVMLAGVECMAEGHSFHLANNVILIAYSWAYDKFIQALNRVHRMTSPKPVNIYVVIAHGTIDRKLESLIQDKGDAAELVLDGRLIGERTEEINLAELLSIAQREFNTQNNTIDETTLVKQWPALRSRLALAMRHWTDGAAVQTAAPGTKPTAIRRLKNITPQTNSVPEYLPVIRRTIITNVPPPIKTEPTMKYEIHPNSKLAAVFPVGTIVEVPPGAKRVLPAASIPDPDWQRKMSERASKLKALMKPKADTWGSL